MAEFGSDQLHAQIGALLLSWRYEWSTSMPLFRAQLFLVGYLVYRSGYIPKIIGALVAIAGLGYVISYLSPFLYPNAYLGFIMVTFFGELIFMLWLLVQGGRIKEPTA